MNRLVNNLYTAIILVNVLAVAILGIVGGNAGKQRAAAVAEAADLRAQLAEVQEREASAEELPKELLAVEEAYTPAAEPEPPVRTVDVKGQICELAPASETVGAELIGTFKVTHYAPCVACCGNSEGIGASGRKVIPYYSVGVDPDVIPLGSIICLDYGDGVLHEVRADDTGDLVKGNVIDLCVSDYETAKQMGIRSATVYRWRSSDD